MNISNHLRAIGNFQFSSKVKAGPGKKPFGGRVQRSREDVN